MSDQESNRIRRIVGWGIVGLIVVIGLSITLSLYYFAPWRPGGGFDYPFFFSFPFHFGWLGANLLDIHSLLGSKMVFLALETRRRILLVSAPAKTGCGFNCQREICKRRNNKRAV